MGRVAGQSKQTWLAVTALTLRNCWFLSAVGTQICPLPAAVKLPSSRKFPELWWEYVFLLLFDIVGAWVCMLLGDLLQGNHKVRTAADEEEEEKALEEERLRRSTVVLLRLDVTVAWAH